MSFIGARSSLPRFFAKSLLALAFWYASAQFRVDLRSNFLRNGGEIVTLDLSAGAAVPMHACTQLRAGDRVVDMATGTADVAIMISRELAKLEEEAPGGQGTVPGTIYPGVVGIDPSARMLEVRLAQPAGVGVLHMRKQLGGLFRMHTFCRPLVEAAGVKN